jgi:hypothetical protein
VTTPRLQTALALALTSLSLWGLLAWDPFLQLRDAFAKTGPGREDALVSFLFEDASSQEVSKGQHPLESLRELESSWCSIPKQERYILVGNSQTFTVLLAPSEAPQETAERTYPDILLDLLAAAGIAAHGYRLSAPNISYMEVLWYLNYILLHPCLVPSELVLQLNFETFRKTGIREGMLELLEDPHFASSIDEEALSNAPYSSTFQQATAQYKSRIAKETGNAQIGRESTSTTGFTQALGFGNVLETDARAALNRLSILTLRGQFKGELLDALYLARVRWLGITPTTKRSIGGATLAMNVASLQRIGELCRQGGIRLVFFNAPQNPAAPLYRTTSDRSKYTEVISQLSRKYAEKYFDFETSIPGDLWGVWIDGSDPIHFGRAAHRRLAELMFQQGVIAAAKN